MSELTQVELKNLLDYDQVTGVFTWKINNGQARVGNVAGTIHRGYIQIGINGKVYLAHRLAWLISYGSWPSKRIDHKNRIKNDNRLVNLNDVSNADNSQNKIKARVDSTSGLIGAHKKGKRWASIIHVDKKKHHLGVFDTAEEAHEVYMNFKNKLHTYFKALSEVYLEERDNSGVYISPNIGVYTS